MRLLSRLAWTGWRRGLREGSTGWLTVAVGITTLRVAARLLREREVRASVELHTGDAIEVRVVDPPGH